MMCNRKRHIELLKRSQDLKFQVQILIHFFFDKFEDASNFDDFQSVIDTHFFYFHKTNYRKYFSFFLPDFSRNPAKNISPNFRQNH